MITTKIIIKLSRADDNLSLLVDKKYGEIWTQLFYTRCQKIQSDMTSSFL